MKTFLRLAAVAVTLVLPALGVVYDELRGPNPCPRESCILEKAREARQKRTRLAQASCPSTIPAPAAPLTTHS
jgi:hypothetical protein